jgi:hypothetical protein
VFRNARFAAIALSRALTGSRSQVQIDRIKISPCPERADAVGVAAAAGPAVRARASESFGTGALLHPVLQRAEVDGGRGKVCAGTAESETLCDGNGAVASCLTKPCATSPVDLAAALYRPLPTHERIEL